MSITLIGMAGVGKTVVGSELAKRLDYSFVDMDEVIEKKTGSTLQRLLDDLGDEGFMAIEEQAVLELEAPEKCVISTGGSVVYSAKGMEFLKKNSTVVFLDSPLESIRKRITNRDTRGIVGLRDKSLRELYDERLILYRRYADVEIELPEESDVDDTVQHIIESMRLSH